MTELLLIWTSLGVFGVGLGVLADVTGSSALIWRFRAEQRRPGQRGTHEAQAAIIVAVALAVVSVVFAVQTAIALASGSRPGTSVVTLIAASVSLVVLTPLAIAKRRLGRQMNSPALEGDGALSGIGAATSPNTLRRWSASQPDGYLVPTGRHSSSTATG